VLPNITKIDFSEFTKLFDRIMAAIDHHNQRRALPPSKAISRRVQTASLQFLQTSFTFFISSNMSFCLSKIKTAA